MPAAKYIGSYSGIGEMLRSDWLVAHLVSRAERVKAIASATAPIGRPSDGDEHPGVFRDSFRVVKGTENAKGGGVRAVVHVVSLDPLGAYKELGSTRRTRNHAGADALGLFEAESYADVGATYTHVEGSHTLLNALRGANN